MSSHAYSTASTLEPLAAAAVEGRHVLVGEGVGEREHRHAVRDLGEALARRRAHALRGRIGRGELRDASASSATSSRNSAVVLGVGDLRRVLVVVEAVVALDLAAQLCGPRRRRARRGHAQENSRRASAPPAGMPCASMSRHDLLERTADRGEARSVSGLAVVVDQLAAERARERLGERAPCRRRPPAGRPRAARRGRR